LLFRVGACHGASMPYRAQRVVAVHNIPVHLRKIMRVDARHGASMPYRAQRVVAEHNIPVHLRLVKKKQFDPPLLSSRCGDVGRRQR